jgi:tetratricopeptide (TPR) repeat protein
MILIYGCYHWGKKGCVSDRTFCPICGRDNRPIRSYSAWEVGHAMFVPLMPWGRIRVVGHCLTCKRFYKFVLTGRKLKAVIEEQRTEALARVGRDIDQTLSDLASLAHLGDFDGPQSILDRLAGQGEAEHALAEARLMSLLGDVTRAEESYLKALQLDPETGRPGFWFGQFLLIHERDEEAVVQLRRAGEVTPGDGHLALLWDFVHVRKQQKNWHGLTTIMTEIVRSHPDAVDDKWFAKLYVKACRKSGRAPEETNPYTQL